MTTSRGTVIKNNLRVNCSETLKLPISADEQVCLFKEFNLKATINHSGTLQAGHYWAHKNDEDNRGWLKCNDTSVIAINTFHWFKQHFFMCFLLCSNLNFSIILQGDLTPCLILGCDVPTYNPSPARKSTAPA